MAAEPDYVDVGVAEMKILHRKYVLKSCNTYKLISGNIWLRTSYNCRGSQARVNRATTTINIFITYKSYHYLKFHINEYHFHKEGYIKVVPFRVEVKTFSSDLVPNMIWIDHSPSSYCSLPPGLCPAEQHRESSCSTGWWPSCNTFR